MNNDPAGVYLDAPRKQPDESWEEYKKRIAKLRAEGKVHEQAESEEQDRFIQGMKEFLRNQEEFIRTNRLEIDAIEARLAAEQAEKKQPSPPPFATEEFQLHRRNNGQRAPAHSPRQFAPAVASSRQPATTEARSRHRCTIL